MQPTERILEILDNAQCRAASMIKEQFLAGYVSLGKQHGFDLTQGDVALVNADDVPKAVTLIRERDPVWVHHMIEPGKTLFVTRTAKLLPVYSRLNG